MDDLRKALKKVIKPMGIDSPIDLFERFWDRGAIVKSKAEFEKIKTEINNIQSYREKLKYLFFVTGELYFEFEIYELIKPKTSPEDYTLLNYDTAIDLKPRNKDEYRVFNELAQELLFNENKRRNERFNKKGFYCTFEQFLNEFEKAVSLDASNEMNVIKNRVERIRSLFNINDDANLISDVEFDDSPDIMIGLRNDCKASELFKSFQINGEIDYTEYINPWHHLEILSTKEVYKFYKYLQSRLEGEGHNEALDFINISNACITDSYLVIEENNKSKNDSEIKYSGVHVIPSKVDQLFNAICVKFNPNEYSKLKLLLSGSKLDGKVFFNGGASQIANAFGQLWKNDYISAKNLTAVGKWIEEYFEYNNDGERTEIKFKSIYDTVRLKERCKNPIIVIDENGVIAAKIK